MKRIITMALFVGLLAGCAPQARLTVQRPAELDTTGIRKIAVGPFEVMMVEELVQSERNGQWQNQPVALSKAEKQALAKQIRAQVIAKLAETPYFELVYTDEFEKLGTSEQMENAIAASGYKNREAQAIISGKLWVQLTKTNGANPKKQDLEFVSGGRRSFAVSVGKVIWWPYKSLKGTLAVELKLLRTVPTEVVAVSTETREFSHRIGGEPLDMMNALTSSAQNFAEGSDQDKKKSIETSDEVLPSFEMLLSDLSGSVASDFIRKVSVTTTHLPLSIATGGDKRSQMLVQAGAYQMAIDQLQKITATEPNSDDLYNLGLSFEAVGEYGLARLNYKEAFNASPENALYAQGLGRIEKVTRSKAGLRRQLQDKGNK